jgi:hypothetical protein
MHKKRRAATKAYPARGAGPQFQIACVLLNADATREDLVAKLQDLDAQSLSNALWSLKTKKRASKDGEGTWSLTPAGRAWATGGANLDNQRASAAPPPSPAAVKRSRREPAVLAQDLSAGEQRRLGVVPAVVEPVARPSFRCAVISDGGFFIEKNGNRIDLEPDESRAMVRYLDRMADQAA